MSPPDARFLADLTNPEPGTVRWVSVTELPSQLQTELLANRQKRAGTEAQARSNYFVLPMQEGERGVFEVVQTRLVRSPDALGDETVRRLTPVSAAALPSPVEELGYTKEGVMRGDVWPRVGRLFRSRDGTLFFLVEFDLVAAGASVTGVIENVNASVNGGRATLIAFVDAASKDVVWSLTWFATGKQYELLVKGKPLDERGAAEVAVFASAVRR